MNIVFDVIVENHFQVYILRIHIVSYTVKKRTLKKIAPSSEFIHNKDYPNSNTYDRTKPTESNCYNTCLL